MTKSVDHSKQQVTPQLLEVNVWCGEFTSSIDSLVTTQFCLLSNHFTVYQ